MARPTDGYGLYESVTILSNSAVYHPRLDTIAAGGFKLVMNYDMLSGHIADLLDYINYAASVGLKVIMNLSSPHIWKAGDYATTYPSMYADSGNAATGTLFMQYIVNQVKALSGLWGYYIGDENVVGDHATWATYAAAIKTADSTHPRLVVESATPGASNFYQGSTLYFDQCEVGGDDYYPLGDTAISDTPATVTSGIQSFCNTKSIQSAIVLQAFSWQTDTPPVRCQPYPACSPWPYYVDYATNLAVVVTNMTPRLVLWFAYHRILLADNPTKCWNDLVATITNVGHPTYRRF